MSTRSAVLELDGTRYRVSLAPPESPAYSSPACAMQSVCFETEEGHWIGSALVYYHIEDLLDVSDTHLRLLLRQALEEG